MGKVGRLESLESGEGPCALVRAQERMRSRDESESGEVFFIDVESAARIVVLLGESPLRSDGEVGRKTWGEVVEIGQRPVGVNKKCGNRERRYQAEGGAGLLLFAGKPDPRC